MAEHAKQHKKTNNLFINVSVPKHLVYEWLRDDVRGYATLNSGDVVGAENRGDVMVFAIEIKKEGA